MAQTKKRDTKTTATKQGAAKQINPYENIFWIMGVIICLMGLLSFFSVLSHFFNWSSDLSALRNDEELTGEVIPFENICGSIGARIAYWLVDCSFGLFGIIIPVVITVVGWRIFRRSKLGLNHFALSAALILVMGSVTMGFVASLWELDLNIGGDFGHACVVDLDGMIGMFGLAFVLLAGWVLTGVFINRNFIHIVNGFSDTLVHQSERLATVVKDGVVRSVKNGGDELPAEQQEQSVDQGVEQLQEQEPLRAKEEESAVAAGEMPGRAYEGAQPQPYQQSQPYTQSYTASSAATERVVREPVIEDIVLEVPNSNPEGSRTTLNDAYKAAGGVNIPAREYGRETLPVVERYDDELIGAEEEDEFYVEPNTPVEQMAVGEESGEPIPFEDEDGFIVIPNGGARPNQIDVDALLERKETPQVDDEGFEVVPRVKEQQENSASAVAAQLPPAPQLVEEQQPEVATQEREQGDDRAQGLVVKVVENRPKTIAEDDIDNSLYDPLRDLEGYKKPYVSLLEDYRSPHKVSDAEIYDNKCRIQETLKYFGIPIEQINATVGPTVTLYEIVQAPGVKISKIEGLEKDIAQSLKSLGIRIIAPMAGRGTIGIEVPNRDKQIVSMYSAICSEEFQSSKAELPIVIGRTIQNENYTFDLAKMPHLLVAGATGQGKSVGLNAIITSLLYRKHPAELKFVLIDPKMVEFSVYNRLERHFLAKMESEDEAIVTEPRKAVNVLNSLVVEMGRRLELCKMATARNITEYNQKFTARRLNPQRGHRFLPYIVVVIDEFADLIMTAKEVEVPVMRLAQKARAVGIHLIVATQRPDVKIITGTIKANFPARIAFRVMQMIDSRTIIDEPGANQLIGRGDMLFKKDGELTRIQCALVETREVENLVNYISKQQGYGEAYSLPDYSPEGAEGDDGYLSGGGGESGAPVKYDVLFGEIARAAVTNGVITTSSIQRNYEVGFNRAGRIMLQLEKAGIVGPQIGAKHREIKFYDLPSLEAKLQELGVF